jgi:large subunit ribosomal protein L29
MKADEVHKMSEQELAEESDRLRKRLYELRCQAVTEKLENPRQMTNLRRDVARLLTEQQQRQLAKRPKRPKRLSRRERRQAAKESA